MGTLKWAKGSNSLLWGIISGSVSYHYQYSKMTALELTVFHLKNNDILLFLTHPLKTSHIMACNAKA